MPRLNELFTITYGNRKLHNKEFLEDGDTLVISSQGTDNGVYGFFDTKSTINPPVISVPSTGSIGESFVQLHSCSIDDNCLVLKPKTKLNVNYLYYVADRIRNAKWRFMYGRQITPLRLGRLQVIEEDNFVSPQIPYDELAKKLTPIKDKPQKILLDEPKLKLVQITELFDLKRGHFHAIDKLKSGRYTTISRVATNNGIVGFFERPKKAKIFSKFLITVSTVAGDTFLQYVPFIATDNVVICIPKKDLRVTTLLYVQSVLDKGKWRYSYGRQCYKGTLQKTRLYLPYTKQDELDEDYIEKLVKTTSYWKALKNSLIDQY